MYLKSKKLNQNHLNVRKNKFYKRNKFWNRKFLIKKFDWKKKKRTKLI